MKEQTPKDWAWTLLIVVIVIGAGLFAFNQFFAWQFKSQLLQSPCQLCVSINPNFTRCSYELKNNLQYSLPSVNLSALNITS